MAELDEKSDSVYAAEGTIAHVVAEGVAALRLGLKPPPMPNPADITEEMKEHAEAYAQYLLALQSDGFGYDTVLLEQQVNPRVPECYGTADAVLLAPTKLTVVDYKFGRGVPVEAEENPQLMLYGLGALETFDLITEPSVVTLVVYQPRLGNVSSWTVSAARLRQWREDVVLPAAEAALSGLGIFRPSVEACRFCPLSGQCVVRAEAMAVVDFQPPAMMDDEAMGAALTVAQEMASWLKALEAHALERARLRNIPGWKLVRSGGKRTIAEEDVPHAIQTLIDHGFQAEQVGRLGLKTLSELDRLTKPLGGLKAVLGDMVGKTSGRESLVPETDRRAAVTPDFPEED